MRRRKTQRTVVARFTPAQIRAIASAYSPNVTDEQVALLEQKLKGHEDLFEKLATMGIGGTATDRHATARKVRVAMDKLLAAGSPVPETLFSANELIYGIVLYGFAETLDVSAEGAFKQLNVEELFLKELKAGPNKILNIVHDIEIQAKAEMNASSLSVKRKPDEFLDELFMTLMTIYERVFQEPAVTYADSSRGSNGPLARFLAACLANLGIRSHTPLGIRRRVRGLMEKRLKSHPNYSFGDSQIAAKVRRKQKRP